MIRPQSNDQTGMMGEWRFGKGSSKQQPDTTACFLCLLLVIEKSDVKEDSIDTGCVLHYKVNPCQQSHRWADLLRCRDEGFEGEEVENHRCLSGYNKSDGAVSEPEQKPDNWGVKKKKKKVEKCFML